MANTPIIASGTVALGGANVVLATAPSYSGLAIKNVTVTSTDATVTHVSITSQAASRSVYDAEVSSTGGVVDIGEGYHFQPGDVATLVVPAGSGTLAYEVTFELA